MNIKHIIQKHFAVGISIFAIVFFSVFLKTYAAYPNSPYSPGQTLNPNCPPGVTNCTVSIPTGGTGITSLDSLTVASQNFAADSTGNDFTISASNQTHTFHIPYIGVPGVLHGLLSSGDWNNFSLKQDVLSTTPPLSKSGTTLSISQANGSSGGYLSSTDWNTFNNSIVTSFTSPLSKVGTVVSIPVASSSASGYLSSSSWGLANGLATLDGTGVVPSSELPISFNNAVHYKGTWDPNTSLPPSGSPSQGDYYVVNIAGTFSIPCSPSSCTTPWVVGDWAVFDGTNWGRVSNNNVVLSVAGKVGAVTLTQNDIANLTTSSSPAFVGLTLNSVPYTFPSSVGSTGQVLTALNGTGTLTWAPGGGGVGWSLAGNSITPWVDFIGTTNDASFQIKVNNQFSGRIDSPSTSTNDTFFGYKAGLNGYIALNPASNSTAIGYQADFSSLGVQNAIALGAGAIADNNQFALPDAVTNWKFRGQNYALPNAYPTGPNQYLSATQGGAMYWAPVTGGSGGSGGGSSILLGINSGVPTIQTTLNLIAGTNISLTDSGTGSITINSTGTGGLGGTGTLNFLPKFTPNGTTLGNSQIFDSGTNVGIGTITPGAKLEIDGASGTTLKIVDGNQAATKVLTSDANGNASWQAASSSGAGGWTDTGTIIHLTTNTDNVGIGTSSPGAKLEIAGQIKITGGFPGAGKILTSDVAGLATWKFPAGNTGWSLNGNLNTIDGTNFIGTADDVPLTFKVNNIQAGRIDDISSNAFYGFTAGNSNTTGIDNTANGTSALQLNTTGSFNTAVGQLALLFNTSGNYNTALGENSLQSNTTGSNNTAIGVGADVFSPSTSNAIALGFGAIAKDNEFALSPAITNWKFQGVSYVLPLADGNPSDVLTTDGAHTLKWLPVTGSGSGNVTTYSYGGTIIANTTDYNIVLTGGSGATTVDISNSNFAVGAILVISDLDLIANTSHITIDAGANNFIVAGSSNQTYVLSTSGNTAVLQKVTTTQWKVI